MADGLSLVASIIAVLELSGKVLRYAKAVKDGAGERAQLLKDLINIQGSLNSLRSHIELSEPTDPWLRAIQDLAQPSGPLETYKAALERLLNKLDPTNDDVRKRNLFKKAASSLAWPFQTGEVTNILATIERQQRLFNLALSLDSMTLTRAIKADLHDNKMIQRVMTSDLKQTRTDIQEILDISRNRAENEVLEWLSILQPQKNHSDISSRRTSGTGEWIKETKQFDEWFKKLGPSNVLWCSGIPGSGKTYISSMIIDFLKKVTIGEQGAVAFIYCDYHLLERDLEKDLSNITGALLRQLLATEARLPTALIDLYKQTSRSTKALRLDKLQEILISLCNERPRYIVIDALDEYGHTGDRQAFLKLLKRLEATQAMLFYTTRPDQKDIAKHLKFRPHIQVEASESDITEFLNQQINDRIEEEEELEDLLTRDFRNEIISTLVSRANGMFLLPSLQVRSVLDQISPAKIRETLVALPEGLEAQFEATLQRIRNQPKERREIAMKTLLWVSHAFATIDLAMLQHALGVEAGDKILDHSKLTPMSLLRHSIADFCHGLIVIQKETSQVRLVHYTLQEFFESQDLQSYYPAEKMLSEVCLTYVLLKDFASPPPSDDESYNNMSALYPLYWYANQKWGVHVHRLYHQQKPLEIEQLMFRFVFSPLLLARAAQSLSAMLYNNQPLHSGASQDYARIITPVHYAAYFGLPSLLQEALTREFDVNISIVEGRLIGWTALHFIAENLIGDSYGPWFTNLLIEQGAKANAQSSTGETPLHIAVRSNRLETSKALMVHGADPEAQDSNGLRPLHFAARSGANAIVVYLLESGCEVSPQMSDMRSTPLHMAIGQAQIQTAKTLLGYTTDLEKQNKFLQTPLHIAASGGQVETITWLLDKGASIDAKNNFFGTPLTAAAAAKENGAECIRLLIERGAAVNLRTKANDSALIFAAISGHPDVVTALLDRGADLLGHYEGGDTALHAAASRGFEEICQVLLERGAEIDAKNEWGNTALLLTSKHEGTAQMLLEHGANIETKNTDGNTVLHMCIIYGPEGLDDDSVIRAMLEKGADILLSTFNEEGQTAVHLASMEGKTKILRTLVLRGASASMKTSYGTTALHYAARNSLASTQFLIDSGCPVDDQDSFGHTALHVATVAGNIECAHYLLDNGSSINMKDNEEATALHLAAKDGLEEMARLFIQHGASLEDRMSETTALHICTVNDHGDVVRLLIDAGANIEATDSQNCTALHMACEKGNDEIVRLLLDKGANINAYALMENDTFTGADPEVKTGWGSTALQFACESDDEASVAIVKSLVNHGADLNARDLRQSTALFVAALNDSAAITKILIDSGAALEAMNNEGWRAIHWALRKIENLNALIDAGADIDAVIAGGGTCLHGACNLGLDGTCDLLLDKGASLDVIDNIGRTPLAPAIINEHVHIVSRLLDRGAGLSIPDKNGHSALHHAVFSATQSDDAIRETLDTSNSETNLENTDVKAAQGTTSIIDPKETMTNDSTKDQEGKALRTAIESARTRRVEIFQLVLARSSNINIQDNSRSTPLHIAAYAGAPHIIISLLKAGADPTITQNMDFTSLHMAICGKSFPCVKAILNYTDYDLNAQNTSESFLARAITLDDKAIFHYLIAQGAKMETKDSFGRTALFTTVSSTDIDRQYAQVSFLLGNGASVQTEDINDIPLILQAAKRTTRATLQLLFSHGASATAIGPQNSTIVHWAVESEGLENLATVVEHGGDINAKNIHEMTPLLFACFHGHTDLVELLIQRGADLETSDDEGFTPLMIASEQGHEHIVTLLLARGVDVGKKEKKGRTAITAAKLNGRENVLRMLLEHGGGMGEATAIPNRSKGQ
ncbi:uncharacterized protein KY384_003421 [Bacidia gigantensis]|uniref:uncharacterized protein n=1 Tax=Bacidia gigantensis TaxID=2732470 RepID=UPI001D04097A|nr:uncharacterized protein KY384_003421 [Bacidia gigantensis]KAG8531785.1 hypothetical protein KY384_003421 [Bacidia gigantensis]